MLPAGSEGAQWTRTLHGLIYSQFLLPIFSPLINFPKMATTAPAEACTCEQYKNQRRETQNLDDVILDALMRKQQQLEKAVSDKQEEHEERWKEKYRTLERALVDKKEQLDNAVEENRELRELWRQMSDALQKLVKKDEDNEEDSDDNLP